ncbi:DUF4136 domain-containing protein [Winogradskyella sp.]|uniref:DUF4136 domain-containing protein n=1 Tax=Winogradskyella sp. TaxID=1883156 RepID=UPI001B0DE688|nr:DUF4136 domain-containing protein [Winogradskyella sp.]MBO6879842.1 DUF4136 domain-containing protein [Winogradskyella sp.]
MKTIKFIWLVLAVTLFTCGPRVTTEKMSNIDLNDYNTFAYLPNSNFDDFEKFENDNSVGMAVIESVNQNMKDQGYTIDRDNPDLLVLLSTMTDIDKTVTKDPVYATYPRYYHRRYAVSPYYTNYYYNSYYDYSRLVGYETDVNKYKEGMLILRLVDTDSKRVVWEGKASDLIFQQDESAAISEFVDDMFDEFPAAK